jgi:enoyl-CoA hydratase
MSEDIRYVREGKVATITMDDGKVNSISLDKLRNLQRALDQAEAEQAVVLLTGREQRFSAGFDLTALKQGGEIATKMVIGGFELAERLLAFPTPVVIACTGHALAMGAFLLLAADLRIGTAGAFKIGANEVAIGMTVPSAAVELCRLRLAPTHYARSVVTAEIFSPEEAVSAGYLDRVVPASELLASAHKAAADLSLLNMAAYVATKKRVRGDGLKSMRAAIEADASSWRVSSSPL